MSMPSPALRLFTLRNDLGLEVTFSNLGGTIVSLKTRDRHGHFADLTPGYDHIEEYLHDRVYMGCLIGRYANRIAGARFTLDDVTCQLPANDGPNHLHGGPQGFHRVIWEVEPFQTPGSRGALLRHSSPAGTEGYPGNLDVRVTYTLSDNNELIFDYHAVTDRPTVVNLTQHAYFNLAGHNHGSILDHELQIIASHFAPVDASLIPTGELRSVHGTPFDFRKPMRIGAHVHDPDQQLQIGGGYDHCFVLAETGAGGVPMAARLYDPYSGRVLTVATTEPGLQLYSGNSLDLRGKQGAHYGPHSVLALETQHLPDSPNQPAFPNTILQPGQTYTSRTAYAFGVE